MRRFVLAAALAAAVAPFASAHAQVPCAAKVLIEHHEGYTVVNVPTGRCSWQSIVIPVGLR